MTYLSNHNIRLPEKFSHKLCNGSLVFQHTHESGSVLGHKGLIFKEKL
jgi:hypothetical protein